MPAASLNGVAPRYLAQREAAMHQGIRLTNYTVDVRSGGAEFSIS